MKKEFSLVTPLEPGLNYIFAKNTRGDEKRRVSRGNAAVEHLTIIYSSGQGIDLMQKVVDLSLRTVDFAGKFINPSL
jgi:hypothetical protein